MPHSQSNISPSSPVLRGEAAQQQIEQMQQGVEGLNGVLWSAGVQGVTEEPLPGYTEIVGEPDRAAVGGAGRNAGNAGGRAG